MFLRMGARRSGRGERLFQHRRCDYRIVPTVVMGGADRQSNAAFVVPLDKERFNRGSRHVEIAQASGVRSIS